MNNALEKISQAERWLAEAKTLDKLKQIHDIAIAAEAYAQAHRLGIDSENHAREIKFIAARRIGELIPPEKSGPGRGKESLRQTDGLSVPRQRLSEFRKLAEIPENDFRERIEVAKAKEEKITYNKILRGDWYQMSETPEWETPRWLFDILDAEFHFELDVCASHENHKCPRYFTKEDNGLNQSWNGVCWMNPPYGKVIRNWLEKANYAAINGSTVVCLVPANIETRWWWQNCIQGEVRFFPGRLKFVSHNFKSTGTAPFSSAIVVLGKNVIPKVVWWEIHESLTI